MASETLGDILRRIGRSAGLQGVLALTDAQLLERFAAGRDEPAFAALMVRHGPMVLGVCRRMLQDAGQAEDAFQAAFLVLARKAATIQRRPLLSAWLYGVAYKVAARLRGREWKRLAREKPADLDSLAASSVSEGPEWQPAIHEEVQRLPDKYRDPVVLCYLEGKTHEEAAQLLRWPLGTVKGRLARARDMLRSRLTRRGLAPTNGAWTSALLVCPTAPRAALVDATNRAAPLFAAGDATAAGLASARAVALAQGVMRAMILTKVKIGAALALIAALLGGAGGYYTAGWAAEPGPAPKSAARAADKPAPAEKPKDDKEAIQGTWLVSGLETAGKEMPDNNGTKQIKAGNWVITADKITIAVPGQEEHNVSYRLDPTKNPKEIDSTALDGPEIEKGKHITGVYSLDGDVLKICIPGPAPNASRPTEVATKAGGDAMLVILKRQPPAKDKPKEDKPAADKEAIQGTWLVTGLETGGKEAPDNDATKLMKSGKCVITADKVTTTTAGPEHPSTYTLDPTKKPKQIDVTALDGPDKDKVVPAVYSLEGDVLKICFPSPTNAPRPTEVATKAGSDSLLLILKRETAK